MNKLSVLFLSVFLLNGCSPKYIEKQSEPLKQAVYGINDSLSKGRIDLAWYFSNETTHLVTPPQNRVQVKSVFENLPVANSTNSSKVVILPEELKNEKVIVTNSVEYKDLLKNKEIAKQLQNELDEKNKFADTIIKQQKINEKNQSDLLNSYNDAKKEIAEKNSAIWFRNFVILGLFGLIVGYIGLRIAISYGKISMPFII
jgi:PBP1b-binding outer membrane lipoprotein LpoB